MKTFVIGDVHGCYAELGKLVDVTGAVLGGDKLILTGDYIDRGPQSFEVLDYLYGLQARYGNEKLVLLRGNHEQMLLDWIAERSITWEWNGMETTKKSFQYSGEDITYFASFLGNLPYSFEDDNFIYVHAGMKPGRELSMQDKNDLIWIWEEFIHSFYSFGKTVIFGHTPTISIDRGEKPMPEKCTQLIKYKMGQKLFS